MGSARRLIVLTTILIGCNEAPTFPLSVQFETAGTELARVWSPDIDVNCTDDGCKIRGAPAQRPLRLYARPKRPSMKVTWGGTCAPVGLQCVVDVEELSGVILRVTDPPASLEKPNATTVIVLYGQSLANGASGTPALTVDPPFPNEVFVLDRNLVQTCPAREGGSCGPWPNAESPRTAIAETWRRARGSGRFVINNAAVGGARISELAKGTEPYARMLAQASATLRLEGDIVVRGIAFIHGPSDEGRDGYVAAVTQLRADLNQDLRAITGQRTPVPMFIDQTSSWTRGPVVKDSKVAPAQTEICSIDPWIHCVGPQFIYEYASDRLHLVAESYRALGEDFGSKMYEITERNEDAGAPTIANAVSDGQRITVTLVADTPRFDTTSCPEARAMGFALRREKEDVRIREIAFDGDRIVLTANQDLCEDAVLAYGFTAEPNGGGGCRNAGALAPYGNVVDRRGFMQAQIVPIICSR